MFCWKCGAENPEDAKFCIKCGATLEKGPEPNGSNYSSNDAFGQYQNNNEFQRKSTIVNKKKIIIASVAIAAAMIAVIAGVGFFVRNAIKEGIDTIVTSEKEKLLASLENEKNTKDTSSVEEQNTKDKSSVEEAKKAKDTDIDEVLKNAKVGDVIKFGSYEQDNNLSNGQEPIEWVILGERDGHTVLLSEYILDCKDYNEGWSYITWENCKLREWLNNDFFNTAFSVSDKKRIAIAHNENPDSYELYASDTYFKGARGGNKTDDKVFLLSWTEAKDYLDGKLYEDSLGVGNYNQKLLCRPTAYAKTQGARPYSSSNDNKYPSDTVDCFWWWLRSPGAYQNDALLVDKYGALDRISLDNSHGGVRPVILID